MDNMLEESYKTSLYVGKINSNTIPRRDSVRSAIWEMLVKIAEKNNNFTLLSLNQEIVYNDTHIFFRVRDIPEDRLYLLSFLPKGKENTVQKKENIKIAVKDTIDFCNILGDKFNVYVENSLIEFERKKINNYLDISGWEVTSQLTDIPEKISFKHFIYNAKKSKYEYIFKNIGNKKMNIDFMIFSNSLDKNSDEFKYFSNLLENFGDVEGPYKISSSREMMENYIASGYKKKILIFVDKREVFENEYKNLKIYYDTNRIPTQFVSIETIEEKLKPKKLKGVHANLILEILTKVGLKPFVLRPPEDILNNDGILCLSDIETTKSKLFGLLFTYYKEGLKMNEDVQIYNDIPYQINEDEDKIIINEDKIILLAEKIKMLVGERIKIDIVLTREWDKERLKKLIKELNSKGIEIDKVYHISSKTSRFTDEYIISDNIDLNKHPYIIVGRKTAFLRTSTELRIYYSISPLFIRLAFPESREIDENDLIKILWLVRKRIYRIQEIYALKLPEPIYIFKNLRKIYLARIEGRLTLPLDLLI